MLVRSCKKRLWSERPVKLPLLLIHFLTSSGERKSPPLSYPVRIRLSELAKAGERSLKMLKIPVSIAFVFLFLTFAAADDYRVEPLCSNGKGIQKGKECAGKNGSVDFIFPPDSNLKFDNGKLTAKYRYHFVKITNLSGDYRGSVRAIENAEYYYSKKERGKETGVTFDSLPGDYNWVAISSGSNTEIIIRLNYASFLDASLAEMAEEFQKLGSVLLLRLSAREHATAPSISQTIVEKVFERVPVPSEASLGRFVSEQDEEKSFVLINPKIKVRVDTVEKVVAGNDWNYSLRGTQIVEIGRNQKGKIVQTPFLIFDDSLPNNEINNSATDILQSSTADIQMSKALQSCQFLFLFQESFKKNNKKAADTGSTDCANSTATQCNSVFHHFDQVRLQQEAASGKLALDFGMANYKSVFGERNLVTPLITIFLNGRPLDVPLYTTWDQLMDKYPIPPDARLYRTFEREYERVDMPEYAGEMALLPNDRISF